MTEHFSGDGVSAHLAFVDGDGFGDGVDGDDTFWEARCEFVGEVGRDGVFWVEDDGGQ